MYLFYINVYRYMRLNVRHRTFVSADTSALSYKIHRADSELFTLYFKYNFFGVLLLLLE